MAIVLRYWVSLAIALIAIAATACFLAFGLPRTPTPNERKVDLSRVHYYSPALVRRAFAAHGIRLRYGYRVASDLQVLSITPHNDVLSVDVGGRTGQVSWGPRDAYDQTLCNLDVRYDGTNPNTLAAVKAAVAAVAALRLGMICPRVHGGAGLASAAGLIRSLSARRA